MEHGVHEQSTFIKKAQNPQLREIEYLPSHVVQGNSVPRWKPRILRWPYLFSIIAITVSLVILLEIAARKLPVAQSHLIWSPWDGTGAAPASAAGLAKRWPQTSGIVTYSTYEVSSSPPGTSMYTVEGGYAEPNTYHYTATLSATTNGYINPTETEMYTPSIIGSVNYGGTSMVATIAGAYVEPVTFRYTPSTSASSLVPIKSSSNHFIQPDTVRYTPQASTSASTSTFVDLSRSSRYLQPHTSSYTPPVETSAAVISDYIQPTTILYTPSVTSYSSGSSSFTTSLTSWTSSTPAPGAAPGINYENSVQVGPLITPKPRPRPDGAQHETPVTYSTRTLTYYPLFNSQNPKYNHDLLPVKSQGRNGIVIVSQVVSIYPWWGSLISAVFPVVIFTLYRTIWTIFYAAVKLIEPFTLLSRPGGALGKDIMFWYYTSAASLNPLQSLARGHWLLIWASIVYLISGLLPAFGSETLITNTHSCPDPSTAKHRAANPCLGQLMVDLSAVRALQGLLIFATMMALSLSFMLHRRKRTGIYNDPSSIAGVACLTHHPEFVNDFLETGGDASDKEVERQLGGKRYKLGTYQTPDGSYRYGFMPVGNVSDFNWISGHEKGSSNLRTSQEHEPDLLSRVRNVGKSSRRSGIKGKKTSTSTILLDVSFFVAILGLFATILAYRLDFSGDGFNRFFNSDGFGPRFILTLIGGLVAARWKSVHLDIAGKAIYASLANGNVEAKHSICVSKPSTPFSRIWPAYKGKRNFEAATAVTAVFAELLVIALPGVPFTSGERLMQFYICTYLSLTVLAIMLVMIIALMVWRKKYAPTLPRRVDQLQGVVSYVVASGLLRDCEELEMLTTEERDATLQGMGKRWKLAQSEDYWRRWTVDEDTSG